MPAAGGRHGQRRGSPAGVRPHLPSVGAVFAGGHRAGGGHEDPERSHGPGGAETGSFTTIDLITCRPETGEAAFFKYGAAPSYVKKGGTVRRITGGTLPAGLRGGAAAPDVTRATLEPGSFAVMVSDGVADPGRDEWLQNLLAGWDGEDPQTLAGLILSESVRRENLQDDCGVQVLYLSRESGVKKGVRGGINFPALRQNGTI